MHMTSLSRRRKTGAHAGLSLALSAALVAFCAHAAGNPFTPGSIVAYRVGNGTSAISTAATPVFLDEYTQDGTLVQSIALPTAAGTAPSTNPLTASQTGSEGLLNRSIDGSCLTVPGYAASSGTAGVAASSVARVVGFVNAGGTIDTTTTLGSKAFVGSSIRAAATDTCTRVWTSGNGSPAANAGVWFSTKGATTAAQLVATNTQGMAIFNGQLYASVGGKFDAVGTGLPTSGSASTTALANVLADNYRGIAFLALQAGASTDDTLYVINNSAVSLDKYSYDGTNWNAVGSLNLSSPPLAGSVTLQGLSAVALGDGNVALYFTNGNGGIIYRAIDDSGPTGAGATAYSTFATATGQPANAVFYGLAPAPVTAFPGAAPGAPGNATPSAVTANSFTTSWTAPTTGQVDAYVIEVSTSATFASIGQNLIVPSTTTTLAVSGVVTTAPVYYRIRAINGSGASTDLGAGIDLPQTISFGVAPSIAVNGIGTVTATASSGLPVVYASLTPLTCTVSGATVTGVGAGTCTITADQAGNAQYAAAAEATQSFAIGGVSQTISFGTAPANLLVGGTAALSATATSGLAVSFGTLTASVCTVSGSTVTAVGAGACTVTADQAGNAVYLPAPEATQSFNVGQASQTITFGTAPSIVVNGTGSLSASASSGLAVSFASSTSATCTVSGSTVTGVSAGTCTVTASQAGNTNYAAAMPVNQSFAVGQGTQTIGFTVVPSVVVGSSASLGATASSGLPVTFSSVTPATCTVVGNMITALAAGTCTLAANQAGNANFDAAATATESFAVQAPITAFTPGNLVVDTFAGVNNGGADLDTASPIVLQQFQLDTTGTIATQNGSLILPQAGSGNQSPISGEFGSASEGILQQSLNGLYLVVMGYGVNAAAFNAGGVAVYGTAALGQSTSLPAAAQTGTVVTTVPRVVALVGTNAGVDTSTALTSLYNQNNPRSVATIDGTAFWTSGQGATTTDPTQGVAYAAFGASTAAPIDNSTDTRTVSIVNTGSGNALYVSRDRKAASGANDFTNISLLTAADGSVPVSAAGLITTHEVPPASPLSLGSNNGSINLTAATANGVNNARIGSFVYLSPEQYFFASPTVLYVADSGEPKAGGAEAAGLGAGGLQKWILVSGVWTLAYDLVNGLNLVDNATANANTPTAPGVTGLLGLTGRVVDGQVQLFASSYGLNELSQSYVYEITDTLSATSISQVAAEQFVVLFTDPTGQTSIRGLAFAPGVPQVISFAAAPSIGVGATGTVSATGGASGNPVTLASLTTGVCTVSAGTVSAVSAGTCTIAADQAGNAQYSPAVEATLSFTVGGAAQTIAFGTLPSIAIGGNATLVATASSGLAVVFTDLTPTVCTVLGSTVTGVSAGTCTVAADQSGNGTYAAATEVTASFTIASQTQTISLGSVPATLAVGSAATLSASASSGLAVSFASDTPAVCTVSANTVTAVSVGTCTLEADQAGNATYAAAAPVMASLAVTAAGGGSGSGGDNAGEVPLPGWAYVLLALCLMGTMWRMRSSPGQR